MTITSPQPNIPPLTTQKDNFLKDHLFSAVQPETRSIKLVSFNEKFYFSQNSPAYSLVIPVSLPVMGLVIHSDT